jgi:hypothetical protein
VPPAPHPGLPLPDACDTERQGLISFAGTTRHTLCTCRGQRKNRGSAMTITSNDTAVQRAASNGPDACKCVTGPGEGRGWQGGWHGPSAAAAGVRRTASQETLHYGTMDLLKELFFGYYPRHEGIVLVCLRVPTVLGPLLCTGLLLHKLTT